MKKILYGVILFCFYIVSVQEAHANPLSFYVGAKVGYNHSFINNNEISIISGAPTGTRFSSKFSTSSFPVGLTLGMSIPLSSLFSLRTDIEYIYTTPFTHFYTLSSPTDPAVFGLGDETNMHRLFANLYLDIYATQKLYFYLGGGVGIAFIDSNVISPSTFANSGKSTSQFAWNAGGGLGYFITEKISLDLGIRYSDSGSLDERTLLLGNTPTISIPEIRYSAIDVLLTVAYRF